MVQCRGTHEPEAGKAPGKGGVGWGAGEATGLCPRNARMSLGWWVRGVRFLVSEVPL